MEDDISSYEWKFVGTILNDPQQLPDIFRFLAPQDFEDSEFSWIFFSFQKTYDGLTMDTAVWLKKMFEYFLKEGEPEYDYIISNLTDTPAKRLKKRLRELADSAESSWHPVTLARQIRKESLRRAMIEAVESYSRFNIHRGNDLETRAVLINPENC